MFTGIIQTVGRIERIEPLNTKPDQSAQDVKLTIAVNQLPMQDVNIGDSIAVNGACLTVVKFNQTHFDVHVSAETLSCTVGLNVMHEVNLEKALLFSDRIGGHLVTGHVDGIGKVVKLEQVGECILLAIQSPHNLSRLIATKGSITVDGVSLTVNSIEGDIFSVNLIPHTLSWTTFKHLEVGSKVNLEVDLIARYVERVSEWISKGQTA